MALTDPITDPGLDLLNEYKPEPIPPGAKLGAHVGGGNPLYPMLHDHVDFSIPVPAACHRSDRDIQYPMLANDQYGDCVIAERLHNIQHARRHSGLTVPQFTDADALHYYSKIGGFDPNDPSTDQGCDPTIAYDYWRNPGVTLPDGSLDVLAGTAQILPHEGQTIRRAIWEFDGVGLSLSMPIAWQNAEIWDVGGDPLRDPDWQPGGWGGHQVAVWSYDRRRLAVETWGIIRLITWRALGLYGQLVLVGVGRDLVNHQGISETGVIYPTLLTDFGQVG